MVIIKSEREIEIMREAGRIAAKAQREVASSIRPGISTAELDRIAENAIREEGAVPAFKGYGGFPATICASVNEVVIHGIPGKKKILKEGDIISIDTGAVYKGYYSDCARTHPVGCVSSEDMKLIAATKEAFYRGAGTVKPGVHLSSISHAVQEYAEGCGYGVVRDFTGHGVGKTLHEDPRIPNYGKEGKGIILRKGMTLAIEPMLTAGSYAVKVLSDGWTTVTVDGKNAAHYENTIVVTENGYEILTAEEE